MRLRDAFLREIPNVTQKFDYVSRTDGQPVYFGFASNGVADSEPLWLIHYVEYTIGGDVTLIVSKEGAWDNRASLFI